MAGKLAYSQGEVDRIVEEAEVLDRAFAKFRQMQTEHGMDAKEFSAAKTELRRRLDRLRDELDRYLAGEYGIDAPSPLTPLPVGEGNKKPSPSGRGLGEGKYEQWRKSHQPFHWFAEFYGIMRNGGFDVIIGNPPYVEYKNVKNTYRIRGYKTEACGDLYTYVIERSDAILGPAGRFGMIVPVSISGTEGFHELRELVLQNQKSSWCLGFAERPSKLFNGVEKRLAIWVSSRQGSQETLWLSKYHRWLTEERDHLFATLQFTGMGELPNLVGSSLPKIETGVEHSILQKLSGQQRLDTQWSRKSSKYEIYYTRKVRYFVQFFDFVPEIRDAKGKLIPPSELKSIPMSTLLGRDVILGVLNSGLFFWFFNVYSDVRNVNRREIEAFPCSIADMPPEVACSVQKVVKRLMKDFQANSKMLSNDYGNHGKLVIQSFQPRLSKPIIDEIDTVLAQHYGFTPEELDFIINYDIKYWMGADGGNEDDEE